MKTIQRPFAILLLTSALFITTTSTAQTKLPASWQPGMKLSMSYGGGMRYYSYKLEISDTGSFFIENVEGKVSHYKLMLTAKDLDSLLRFLKRNRFDKIETRITGPVDDKGSENISLSWNGHYIGAGESYAQEIDEKYKENYSAIRGYIYSIREKNKKKVKSLPGQEPPQ